MDNQNFKRLKAMELVNKRKILEICPSVPDTSGIYVLTREEGGFKYGYIGQAQKILTRLAQHLTGYQHIDLSIKNHGFYSEENKFGWRMDWYSYQEEMLNEMEQKFIKEYANAGYQLRNKTAGSQWVGKFNINETRPAKTYYDGLKQGYKNAQKLIRQLFKKNLTCSFSGNKEPNKNQQKAMLKFEEFIRVDSEEEDGRD